MEDRQRNSRHGNSRGALAAAAEADLLLVTVTAPFVYHIAEGLRLPSIGVYLQPYWWPYESPHWRPPVELAEFLAAGPPPVLIGFGSMGAGAGQWLGEIVAEAIRHTGVRAVVQAGWAELHVDRTGDVLPIGEVPHGWLLPHTALIVHHGGAGSTAAALRAGVPVVTTPIYADQPMWAGRAAKLGLGPRPVPFRRLDAQRLATAIQQALADPGYRNRARKLAQRISVEDGASHVVAAVNRLA